jgi:uncharacterized membrane protein YbhN (UPF0104 family)
LVVGAFGGLGVAALQSLRWWYVTRPLLAIRYRDALGAVLVGSFFNTVLPARAGDVLRVQFLSGRSGVSRAALFGTELVDFWTDKSGWLPAFALLLATGTPPAWMYRVLVLLAGVVATLLGVAFFGRRLLAKTALGEGWRARLAGGIAASSPRRLVAAALGIAALPWLWETVVLLGATRAAGIHLEPVQGFALLTAFNVAAVIPVPGSVGLHEAASSAVLVSFGVPLERAVAFALLYHASQLLPVLVGGAVSLLLRGPAPAQTPVPVPARAVSIR